MVVPGLDGTQAPQEAPQQGLPQLLATACQLQLNGNLQMGMGQMPQQGMPQQPVQDAWTCPACGTVNTGKFCQECGAKKPE